MVERLADWNLVITTEEWVTRFFFLTGLFVGSNTDALKWFTGIWYSHQQYHHKIAKFRASSAAVFSFRCAILLAKRQRHGMSETQLVNIRSGDSEYPFHRLVGGHLNLWKVHLTIPKRSPAELPKVGDPQIPLNHCFPPAQNQINHHFCWDGFGGFSWKTLLWVELHDSTTFFAEAISNDGAQKAGRSGSEEYPPWN